MNNQEITKKISHYIGEIIVVTIGIFIAFQLNNYSENKKTKNSEISSLKRLVSDLETEKKWLQNYKTKFKRNKDILEDIIYKKKRDNLDSLYFYLAEEYVHYNFNTEYSTLKFSGKLHLISNNSIRYNLVQYYELGYAFYKEVSENHENYVENHLLIYLDKTIRTDSAYLYNPKIVEQKLNDNEFNDYIKTQIMYYNKNYQTINIKRVDKLIKKIENELKTNANN